MIQCTKCLEIKSEEFFRKDLKKINNKKSNCKNCESKADTRYKDNPEKEKQRVKSWRKTQGTNLKNTYKKWALKKNYNLTLEEYNLKLQEQNGVCAICKTPPNKKQLAVDHCHKTGKNRELLCANCNTSLGLLYDDLNIITSLRNYIIKHQEK
jgi:hypothetical protein